MKKSDFHRYMSFLFILMVSLPMFSQNTVNKDHLKDSLYSAFLLDSTFNYIEKINLLTTLTRTFEKSNPEKADTFRKTAFAIAESERDTSSMIRLGLEMAESKNNQCIYQVADEYLHLVSDLYDSKNQEALANINFLLAQNYYDWSRYDLSKSYFDNALILYKFQENVRQIARTYSGLGAIASNFGEYEEAINQMEKARRIYQDIDDQINLARTTMGLGVIFEDWGKTNIALSYYNSAIETFRKKNDFFQEVNLLLHIGDIYLSQDKYDSSLLFYNNALELEPKVNNIKLRSICYSNLGEAYYAMGKYEPAIDYQLLALDLKNQVGDRKRISISLISLGKIHIALGDYNLAEKYIHECLTTSRAANNKDTELESLLYLSKVYEAKKEYSKALNYLNEYIAFKDIVFNEASRKALRDMEIKYHAESIEKENQILRQKDSINSLQLEKQKDSFFIAILVIAFIIIIFIILVIFINFKNKQTKRNYSLLAKKNKEITIQKEKLAALNKELVYSREQYKSIVENATIGMYQTTRDGKIKYANTGLINMLGYKSLKELREVNLNQQKINRKIFIELIEEQHIISGREDTWKRKDGSTMYVFESAWLVKDKEGKKLHYEGIVEDITQRKEIEKALYESQNKLEEMNIILTEQNKDLEILKDEAVAANEIKSQFIANVSHEIRTPLNSIIGFSELLSSSIKSKKQLNYINSIKSSSKNLLHLINNILDLSKVQSSDIEFIYHPVSIYGLMQDIEQVFKLRFIEKKLAFSIFIEKTVPEKIFMDEVRLRQIMVNLVGNSIKYTNDGSISVNIKGKPKGGKIDLGISVIDTGIGINESEIDSIFEAFSQGKDATTKHLEGTGLGLSITKQLVEKMGGTIKVTSKLERGSKFIINIPNVEIAHDTDDTSMLEKFIIKESSKADLEIDTMMPPNTLLKMDKEILSEFKNKFSHHWAELSGSGLINHLATFCKDAIAYANQQKYETLKEYFSTLLFYINQFEIEKIDGFTIVLNKLFDKKPKN